MCTGKATWRINYLSHWQADFSCFLDRRASASLKVVWEDQSHQHVCSLLSPLSKLSTSMVWAIPLVTGSHLSWLFPFPASCSPPAYWQEVSMGNRGNTVAIEAKHCSSKHWCAISAIWLSKLKHIPIGLLWRKWTPSHPTQCSGDTLRTV